MGGRTADGKPVFRVMWGPDVMEVRGQVWKDRDVHGNVIREVAEYRSVPKYEFERWVFEMWTPCEMPEEEWTYSYTEFINGIPFLKLPYPHEGEYECVKVLEAGGAFVPLTDTICDCLVMTAVQNRNIPQARKVAYIKERRAKQEELKDQKIMDILQDRLGPFKTNPFVSVLT